MTLDRFFRLISYTAVFCGFFSLWISGTFGPLESLLFIGAMVGGWFLEGSRWQISEKVGTALIVLSLPAFYAAWKFQIFTFASSEMLVAGILARLILTLTAIKLLQDKSERDWIFLYLMSFFEVLLAAGLSISATYLASFFLYALTMVCAVIAFEIRKTGRNVARSDSVGIVPQEAESFRYFRVSRLPFTAIALVLLIILFAAPLFFVLPRVGGAGIGGNSSGVSTSTGFSDTVRLGGIGRIQQNDEVVMRVRLDAHDNTEGPFYWRGVALDTFDNQSWSKSQALSKQAFVKQERDIIQVNYASGKRELTQQTFYLEPLDTPVLFTLSRVIAIQGNFSVLYKDAYESVSFARSPERISYKVLSDRYLPSADELRSDDEPYPETATRYMQLPPRMDRRIADLAAQVAGRAPNRFEKARAIESYLQNNYGYTLDLKASGREPLADFLFNVREGHCEYFATAMAIMLRSQGIAARVVNGFQQGDYNETAGVYVVRQRNAHSWVEVFFPGDNVWVPFDPTPASAAATPAAGMFARAQQYLEALETFWVQYFVAYDNQQQQSLLRSMRKGFSNYQSSTSSWLASVQDTIGEWWADARGDKGLETSLVTVGWAAAYLVSAVFLAVLGFLFFRYLRRFGIRGWIGRGNHAGMVEFYDRMQDVLASKGFRRDPHQTPLEFAHAVGIAEAVKITRKYHFVRFGDGDLSRDEASEVDRWLKSLESSDVASRIRTDDSD